LLGEQVSLPYQILGVRGEAKKINIRRGFVGWRELFNPASR